LKKKISGMIIIKIICNKLNSKKAIGSHRRDSELNFITWAVLVNGMTGAPGTS
jgi:hypothetical protein